MNAAVFSDTHGNTARMVEAVRRSKPDCIIHLGDYSRDTAVLRREFPELPLYSVCGNCDVGSKAPVRLTVQLGPVKAFLTHGHAYHVDYSLDSLVYAAQEREAKLALFGHTHEAEYREIAGVQVFNPGTAGRGHPLTWGWITVFDNGGFICEIRDL